MALELMTPLAPASLRDLLDGAVAGLSILPLLVVRGRDVEADDLVLIGAAVLAVLEYAIRGQNDVAMQDQSFGSFDLTTSVRQGLLLL
jgi:hypothetical protein